jgi:PKD repeat protein
VTTKSADVLPPSGRAAGVKYVRIDWGDGGGSTQATKATHTYTKTGHFTIRVSATDNAGNAAAVEREITIGGKK